MSAVGTVLPLLQAPTAGKWSGHWYTLNCYSVQDWNGIVAIVTCYELDCPLIESWWGAKFSAPVPPSFLYSGHCFSVPGVQQLGPDIDHSSLSRAEVKERVELRLYTPAGPSWPVLG